jgi:aspartyl-tRNA(Asn)/glutamyl-tRNA(Gln) amidotransferase subunit B
VTQDVLRETNERRIGIREFPINATVLGEVLRRIVDGTITVKGGREIFAALLAAADEGTSPNVDAIDQLIDAGGLRVVRDTAALDAAIDAAIADSPRAVEDFRTGKQQAIGALVGKVMKQVRGADARLVRELLTRKLSGG